MLKVLKTLRTILIKFLDRPLADIRRENEELRQEIRKRDELTFASLIGDSETLLGVKKQVPPSPEQILADAAAIIQYSNSSDYKIWTSEVWAQVLDIMDKLQSSALTAEGLHFYRGGLKSALDILRISYKARFYRDSQSINGQQRRHAEIKR